MLNPSSKLKGEKDMMKYEKARQLKDKIEDIRTNYTADLKVRRFSFRKIEINNRSLASGRQRFVLLIRARKQKQNKRHQFLQTRVNFEAESALKSGS